jgi:hypothetical protein
MPFLPARCLLCATLLTVAATATTAPLRAGLNTPPTAEDDVYQTGIDEAVSVPAPGVLDNDSDADQDVLEAVLVSEPEQGGTLELQPDGSFDYAPPSGFEGNDAFFYRPFDGTDLGNLGEVTIQVGGAPQPYTIYLDEAAFLGAIADLGHLTMTEGFEDDTAWTDARSPFTSPSVVSQAVTWKSNNEISQVTTGSGPARTGTYGFFCLPHGDYATGTDCNTPGNCTDGWVATARGTLFAVGGWIEGNLGKIEFFLDGTLVGFGNDAGVTNAHKFFGVVHPPGFSTFEVHETEGKAEDQKLLFADDFTFGVPAQVTLFVQPGASLGDVTLDWWGGAGPFTVYRSSDPTTVSDPGNALGSTGGRTWSDSPPAGSVTYYRVDVS